MIIPHLRTGWANGWRRYAADKAGGPAVEMAFVAPILVAGLVGVIELAMLAYDRMDMHAAIRAGSQYFMSGGNGLEEARDVIVKSWSDMPKETTVEVTRFCMCGQTPAVCTALCPDGTAPDTYSKIDVKTVLNGLVFDHAQSAHETVRIR